MTGTSRDQEFRAVALRHILGVDGDERRHVRGMFYQCLLFFSLLIAAAWTVLRYPLRWIPQLQLRVCLNFIPTSIGTVGMTDYSPD